MVFFFYLEQAQLNFYFFTDRNRTYTSEFGIRMSGGPENLVPPARKFGEKIGVAFQLVDDVIDLAEARQPVVVVLQCRNADLAGEVVQVLHAATLREWVDLEAAR